MLKPYHFNHLYSHWSFELINLVYQFSLAFSPIAPISRFSRPGKDILEFGAGHGVLGLALAESGANVTLVDVAPKMVAQAEEKIAAKDAFCDLPR